ncbi:MAG TPA: heparan-alpha-glucosaminide N-acetyltransferase [Casimicrobiaceae bacterium]|nr:heparan-alpha-glucosaminide N-acetyltransferase [Casimicrobiaceae bacterium]
MSRHKRRRSRPGSTPPSAGTVHPRSAATTRIAAVDALRGGAILAMIGYHFAFDLTWFGVFRADFNNDALWLTLRALIVSSFLLLVGVSLVLARGARISRHRFWRRIALIAFCAMLVTAGSYFAFPQTFITFGILHCIAVSSVLAWPLVRYPLAALVTGLAIVEIGLQVRLQIFDTRWLNWIGMMTHKPPTEDYVPLFPWLGVVLVGVAVGGWLARKDYRPLQPMSRAAPRWLNWLGKHSLLVYMVHQPILLGMLRVLV